MQISSLAIYLVFNINKIHISQILNRVSKNVVFCVRHSSSDLHFLNRTKTACCLCAEIDFSPNRFTAFIKINFHSAPHLSTSLLLFQLFFLRCYCQRMLSCTPMPSRVIFISVTESWTGQIMPFLTKKYIVAIINGIVLALRCWLLLLLLLCSIGIRESWFIEEIHEI